MITQIKFKIELTGMVHQPAQDNLLNMVALIRAMSPDLNVKLDFPAMIYLDDLEPVKEQAHDPQPRPNS